jgi:hypothetical protein
VTLEARTPTAPWSYAAKDGKVFLVWGTTTIAYIDADTIRCCRERADDATASDGPSRLRL